MARVFVFGSNLAGQHGKGAALFARKHHGALLGVGVGRVGTSYAIPTKDEALRPLPLNVIGRHVADFLVHAREHPGDDFEVTAIGCGLANYRPDDIGPLFAGAPPNCALPAGFVPKVGQRALVCGGRDYEDSQRIYQILDAAVERLGVTEIIHGAAPGADTIAGIWAWERGIPFRAFPADWLTHGRYRAGPIRNKQMLDEGHPDLVIAFPGGTGTADMRRQAQRAGLRVIHIPPRRSRS